MLITDLEAFILRNNKLQQTKLKSASPTAIHKYFKERNLNLNNNANNLINLNNNKLAFLHIRLVPGQLTGQIPFKTRLAKMPQRPKLKEQIHPQLNHSKA
jgi:hypothetical protein